MINRAYRSTTNPRRVGRLTGGRGFLIIVSLVASLGAVALALLIAAGIIAATGTPPLDALQAMWEGAFGGRIQIAGTLTKMTPMILVALGWIIAFSARRINIGFEGQILAGGALATLVGIHGGVLPGPLPLAVGVLAGAVGGGLYAGIAAWLWARRSVNEIISTLLLNFVAAELVNWLVRGPLQEATHTFPRSKTVVAKARWPDLLPRTPLSWAALLALAMVVVVSFLLYSTVWGFRLRLTGANERAARSVGISTITVTVGAIIISGALAGLAGSSLILGGETGSMTDNFSAGYGFSGIVVALVARNSPFATVPAALVFAALIQGGGFMEASIGVSSAVVLITQGLVILFVAASSFLIQNLSSRRVDTVMTTAIAPKKSPHTAMWKPAQSKREDT